MPALVVRRGTAAAKRRLALLLALVTVVAASIAVSTAVHAPAAHAACNGSTPIVLTRFDNSGSRIIGQESAVYPGSTCNGDYHYDGAVLDAYADGSCITAYYLEVYAYYAAQGTACTTGAWSFYGYTDVYGSNSVFVNVKATYSTPDIWSASHGY